MSLNFKIFLYTYLLSYTSVIKFKITWIRKFLINTSVISECSHNTVISLVFKSLFMFIQEFPQLIKIYVIHNYS